MVVFIDVDLKVVVVVVVVVPSSTRYHIVSTYFLHDAFKVLSSVFL